MPSEDATVLRVEVDTRNLEELLEHVREATRELGAQNDRKAELLAREVLHLKLRAASSLLLGVACVILLIVGV